MTREGIAAGLLMVSGLMLFSWFIAWLLDRDGGDAYVVAMFAVFGLVAIIMLLTAPTG